MKFRNTTQSWLSAICIPLVLMLTFGAWTCNAQTQQQKIIAYTELAGNTINALVPVVPGLAAAKPFIQTALAGEQAWEPGQPIPQNVVTSLQAALAQAEQSFSGLTAEQQTLINILAAAIVSGLEIAGVTTAPRMGATNPYLGKSPADLKKIFNKNAKAAGVNTI